ncbi:hypothetical protein J8I29_07020 [Labrys sp. LIt4]|nr:hypothetical protein [Labrys sp. LIt4]
MDEEVVSHMFQQQVEAIVAEPPFGFDPFVVAWHVAASLEQQSHVMLDLVSKTDQQALIGWRESGFILLLNHQRPKNLSLRPIDRCTKKGLPCPDVGDCSRLSVSAGGSVGGACNHFTEMLQGASVRHRTRTMTVIGLPADGNDLTALADALHDKCDRVLQEPRQNIGDSGPSLQDGSRNGRLDLARITHLPLAAPPIRRHACFPLKHIA